MIPYFELRRIPLGGELSLASYGTLVVAGVVAGAWLVRRRARTLGLPVGEIDGAIVSAVLPGFLLGHVVEVLVYQPGALRREGWLTLLAFWNGLSSFGGFAGAALGVAIYYWRLGRSWWLDADVLVQGLVLGWAFGRLGCTLVHDHVGVPSSFPLAIRFPHGPRHDLGLYELLYTLLVLLPAVAWLQRRPSRAGTTVAVVCLLYAPARFLADFLRNADLPGADPRILGLTPAQYACILLVAVGCYLWRRSHARRPG